MLLNHDDPDLIELNKAISLQSNGVKETVTELMHITKYMRKFSSRVFSHIKVIPERFYSEENIVFEVSTALHYTLDSVIDGLIVYEEFVKLYRTYRREMDFHLIEWSYMLALQLKNSLSTSGNGLIIVDMSLEELEALISNTLLLTIDVYLGRVIAVNYS